VIGLYFILGGKDYAYRSWPAVPRVGDLVLLKDEQRDYAIHPARVLTVVWGTRDQPGDFCCTLEIEWETKP
jgi:hypothetical protein